MTHLWTHLDHYHAMNHFAQRAMGLEPDFPQYCFIEPTYFGSGQNDEHPPTDVWKGEALIATVYNVLRQNDKLWNKTLLIVLYDEHGGFFDQVLPTPCVAPDGHTDEYSFTQYGVRVPAILISPWIGPGVVSTEFDHTSILKYLVDKWNLGPGQLGKRTDAAATFAPNLQKLDAPRTDTPAQLPVPMPAVQPMDLARSPVMLTGHQEALVAFSHYLEWRTRGVEPDVDIVRRTIQGAESIAAHGEVAVERARNFINYRLRGLV